MKRLLNTLYLTRDGIYLNKERETFKVMKDTKTLMKVPVGTINQIICIGSVTLTPPVMAFCVDQGVSVVYLSEYGRFQVRLEGPTSGNILLRRRQYAIAQEPNTALDVSRSFVLGKLVNAKRVLSRALADHGDRLDQGAFTTTLQRYREARQQVLQTDNLDSLRGIEGELAKRYFALFDQMILNNKEDFYFKGRSRRPPLDRINALLSFLYALLLADCRAALEGVGLDSAAGYLHQDRPGRPGLALDLMEEFRPLLADRLALSLVNRSQVNADDFTLQSAGAVLLNDSGRRKVVAAYQERKTTDITHPFLNEKFAQGLLPHAQALLLARYIRGDLDAYPPYYWK
ncbi:MAG: type I-C CRISPR-associated endonuclease Cas1c [bacterium]|nr:type I-C CRISPR-associated endonuclease Cas1c [bacterium]